MTLSPEIWALIGVGLGAGLTWLFNEISTARTRRYEDRKPLGRALSLLLEVHSWLFFYEVCRRSAEKADSPLAKDLARQLKLNMPLFSLSDDELENTYALAVEDVAAFSPLLAFELRNKFQVRTFFTKLRPKEEGKGGPEVDLASALGDYAIKRAIPALERVMLDVAKNFGRKEHRELRTHFKELHRRLEKLPTGPNEAK